MVGILHIINFYSYSFMNMRVLAYSFVFLRPLEMLMRLS